MVWTWARGAAITEADLGDPFSGTTLYTLCVYDYSGGVPTLTHFTTIPYNRICNGVPCWNKSIRGLLFVDRYKRTDGLYRFSIFKGAAGRSNIKYFAYGPNVGMPQLPMRQDPKVTVQLFNTRNVCWSTSYMAPALRNRSGRFLDFQ